MTEQDNDKLKKLFALLDDAVEEGEVVMSDGKIGISDLTSAPEFIRIINELVGLWKHKDEIISEFKDLDPQEVKELIDVAFNG